jgi:S1-C subfamily serine protease
MKSNSVAERLPCTKSRIYGRESGLRADLALLKADPPSSIATFRGGPAPKLGDSVLAFGFPLPGLLSSEGNVSTGILSAMSGLRNDVRFVQISTPVQPGNSGGPLLDSSGHVIGIVVAKLDALSWRKSLATYHRT